AARFRLRAQSFEIQALRLEKQWLRWFGSSVLHVTTGYGDHLPRIFGCYFLFISSFGIIYFLLNNYYLAHQQWDFPHLFNDGWAKFWDAMVYSVTAFHGRGFFPGFAQLPGMSMATTAHDPRVVLGALEAMIGVFIELTLLA